MIKNMTPEEKLQLDKIQQDLNKLIDLFYRTNFIDKVVFTNPVYFRGNAFLPTRTAFFASNTLVGKQTAITPPTGSGTAGVDTPARTAISDIITKLQTLGLTA